MSPEKVICVIKEFARLLAPARANRMSTALAFRGVPGRRYIRIIKAAEDGVINRMMPNSTAGAHQTTRRKSPGAPLWPGYHV